MNRTLNSIFLFAVMMLGVVGASHATVIEYSVTNIAGNTWEYTYSVENDTLVIEEFTIFFEVGLYENITPSATPVDWDPLAIQPDPGLPDDGFYDALALGSGIGQWDSLGGFSVQFDFLGLDTPGAQAFDIVDPVTFDILDFGTTVLAAQPPTQVSEPGVLSLVAGAMLLLAGFRRRNT